MIRFNVFQARQQLINKGFVYTIRTGVKKDIDLAICNSGSAVMHMGKVKIDFICFVITPYDLEFYVKDSGFIDKLEWYTLACKLHKKRPLVLYRVELIK